MKTEDNKSGSKSVYDLAVVGGGPGGYVAAIRAAQLGKKTALIEKDEIGGVCMNWGCIPTKYLLNQTKLIKDVAGNKNLEGEPPCLNWEKVQLEKARIVSRLVKGIEFLLEKNGVDVIRGEGRPVGEKILIRSPEADLEISASKTILAMGSRPAALPFLKPDGLRVLTSRQALDLGRIPASLIIIGAGAIGLEMATIFSRMGSEVRVLEMMPSILPGSDGEMAARLERVLKKQKIRVLTDMRLEESRVSNEGVLLRGVSLKTDKPFEYQSECVLLAVGRKPNSESLREDLPGLRMDRAGFVSVDASLRTSMSGFYAIGDLTGGKLLAHKASHEGVTAAEHAAGQKTSMDYHAVPAAVFTDPEFATVGLTQEEAEKEGREIKVGTFMLQASGRAVTMGETDGSVKILADSSDRIVGAHILAPHAGDMIPELSLAVNRGLSLNDLITTIYIHPTLSECLGEAALSADNRALHKLNNL
jgi:dihydrolipoamide dehydrogenase